jgi:hypothetical protein
MTTNSTRNTPITPVTINGQGVITNVGSATINGNNTGFYNYTGQMAPSIKARSTDPDLPSIYLYGHDEAGNKVRMELIPERSISPYESIQLSMMLVCSAAGANDFCPLAFVKKNNLERHFSFS